MRRGTALVGSAILHAALGVALIAAGSRGDEPASPRPTTTTIDIEVAPTTAITRSIRADAGGGSPDTHSSTEIATPAPTAAPAKSDLVAMRAPRRATGAALAGSLITGIDRPNSGGSTGDGGDGGGFGGGRGTGFGLGTGSGIADLPKVPPVPPAPPPPSLARPPRLIYPSRQRDVEMTELFVMSVKVDTDGYVVGAHLVHGPGGLRDDEALQLIWKFRYDPALDDDGRAIAATIEQHFGVNH